MQPSMPRLGTDWPMRVLLTHPYSWPYVRRGTERNIEVWYQYLNRSGHQARILATIPADAEPSADPNKILLRQSWSPWMNRLRLTPMHSFFWSVWRTIPKIDTDVIHSYYFYDSLAASCRRQRGGRFGTVLQLNGVPVPGLSCRRFLPPEGPAMRRAVARADRCIVCSEFVKDLLREHMNGEAIVIPPPVDPEAWPIGVGPRLDPPVILAVGNFNERRKGIRLLVKAFEQLRLEGRQVRLRISGTLNQELQNELQRSARAFSGDMEFLGLGRAEDLPEIYQTAAVLALPALWEPSGTVMMEAWLSGTPVVAARHGGLPEFFAPGAGFLFDPAADGEESRNVTGLAESLDAAIALSRLSETRRVCRAHGEKFSPAEVGPRFLDVYRQVTYGHSLLS